MRGSLVPCRIVKTSKMVTCRALKPFAGESTNADKCKEKILQKCRILISTLAPKLQLLAEIVSRTGLLPTYILYEQLPCVYLASSAVSNK